MSRSVVTLTGVSKRFRGNTVVTDVDLAVGRGRVHALIGPNGSGKSVLLRILCGLMPADAGTVDIDPALLSPGRTFPDRVGILIDGPAYLPHRSGIDNLLELAAIRRRIDAAQVRAAMLNFGLDPNSRKPVRRYSSGMKQRLALAQAVMERPELLILDEPFTALDRAECEHLARELEHQRELGTTVVFTTHEARYVERLADVVYEIDAQRVGVVRDGGSGAPA